MTDIVRNEKNWEAEFDNITYKQAQEIAKHENVKEVSVYRELGMSAIYLHEELTSNLKVRAYDGNALKNEKIILKKGRLPSNANEILISAMSKNTTTIEDKIDLNQKLELNINGETHEYIVVGLADNLDFDENKGLSFVINIGAIVCLDESMLNEDTVVNVSILTNNIQKIYKTVESITNEFGWEAEKESVSSEANQNIIKHLTREEEQAILESLFIQDTKLDNEDTDNALKVSFNTKLLNYSCVIEGNSEFAKTLVKVGACVIVLVMAVSILVIYTAFKMTYSERLKEFGSLLSLGMNKKGLKQMARREAFILGSVGIAIGMFLGFLISNVIIKVLNIFISRTIDSKYLFILIDNNVSMTLHFPFIVILLAIILVYVIVLISCMLPIKKAIKGNIIENVKSMKDIKCKNKQLRYPKLIGKLFKEEGIIGYKNIKRDKIRYRTIVVSIIISIVLFVSVSGYISNIYGYEESVQKYNDYRIDISTFSLVNPNSLEAVLDYLEYNKLVNDYYIVDIALNPSTLTLAENEKTDAIKQMINDKVITEDISGLKPLKFTDNLYNHLLEKAGVSSLKDDEIIILNAIDKKTKYGDKIQITNFKVGDTINTFLKDRTSKTFKIARRIR